MRAGELGLPLVLANITQPPANLSPVKSPSYRSASRKPADTQAPPRRSALATHVHVAEDSQTARDEFYPHYSAYFRTHTPRDIARRGHAGRL